MRVPKIQREKVDSSSIAAIGYFQSNAILEVEFVRGPVYRYLDVPPATFHDFLAANSKGVFFNSAVRDRFHYERL